MLALKSLNRLVTIVNLFYVFALPQIREYTLKLTQADGANEQALILITVDFVTIRSR